MRAGIQFFFHSMALLSHLFLKYQGLISTDGQNTGNYALLVLKDKCYGDSSSQCMCPMAGMSGVEPVSLPSPCLQWHILLWTVLWISLVPDCISTLPTVFSMAFSLWLAVESQFCQSSGSCLGH